MSAVGAGEALRFADIVPPSGASGLTPVLYSALPEDVWPQYGRPVAIYTDNTIRDQNGDIIRDLAPAPLSVGGGLTWRDFSRQSNGNPWPGPAGGILETATGQDKIVLGATLAAGVERGFAAPTATPWQPIQEGPLLGNIVYTDGSIRAPDTGAVIRPAGTVLPQNAGEQIRYVTTLPALTPAGVAAVTARAPALTTDPSNAGAMTPTVEVLYRDAASLEKSAADPANGPNVLGAGVTLTSPVPATSLGGDGAYSGVETLGAPSPATGGAPPTTGSALGFLTGSLGGVPVWAILAAVVGLYVATRKGR